MVFVSTFEDSKPPEQFKDSLSEFFWHQLDVFKDKTLLVDYESGRSWTGAQIKRKCSEIANYLIDELGLKPRNSCVLFYKNNDHAQLVTVATLFAGGSVCAGYPDDPQAEHAHMIKCLEPAIVFASKNLLQELLDIRQKSCGEFKFKICIIDLEEGQERGFELKDHSFVAAGLSKHLLDHHEQSTSNGSGKLASSEIKINNNCSRLPIRVDPDDPAFVLLTSGSTGQPKPVARSHRNSIYVCFSLEGASDLWHLDENSILAGHLQLDHGTGTFSLKMTLSKGLKMIVIDGYKFETLLDAIDRFKVTDCMLGSAHLHNIMSAPESSLSKYNLSSLKNFIAIGSPLASYSRALEFMDRYPNLSVRQAFGMTECGFLCIVPRADSREDSKSVGMLLPNVRMKLINLNTGKEVTEVEEEGELFVAGPTVSPGYLGAALELTRTAFQADGFYRSNDVCSMLPNNRLRVKGRRTDVLCLNDGWKVLAHELELVLQEHPGVLEAAVVGIPHPTLQTMHAPRAYVVAKESWRSRLDESELFDFSAARLSAPKHLTGGIKLMDQLPRVSLGKVDKRALLKLDGY